MDREDGGLLALPCAARGGVAPGGVVEGVVLALRVVEGLDEHGEGGDDAVFGGDRVGRARVAEGGGGVRGVGLEALVREVEDARLGEFGGLAPDGGEFVGDGDLLFGEGADLEALASVEFLDGGVLAGARAERDLALEEGAVLLAQFGEDALVLERLLCLVDALRLAQGLFEGGEGSALGLEGAGRVGRAGAQRGDRGDLRFAGAGDESRDGREFSPAGVGESARRACCG